MIKTHIVCDRRVYTYTGTWQNPNQDLKGKFFYYIEKPMTLAESFERSIEQLKETIVIRVFGQHPIAVRDEITLANGHKYKVYDITLYDLEPNILVRDITKTRVESMSLVLQ